MPRTARPSDLYRLPAQQPPLAVPPSPPDGDRDEDPVVPTRRSRRPLTVLGVLAIGAVLTLAVGAVAVRPSSRPQTQAPPGTLLTAAPALDQQTSIALALHAAEANAVRDVASSDDRYDSLSLLGASAMLGDAAEHVGRHLQESRELDRTGSSRSSYAWDGGHDLLVRRLRQGEAMTRDLAVLQALHSRVFSYPPPAPDELVRARELSRPDGSPSSRWAQELAGALQARAAAGGRVTRSPAAVRARAAALQAWHNHTMILRQPAAVQRLRSQLISLEPAAVLELRAHPRFGPRVNDLLPPGWPPVAP